MITVYNKTAQVVCDHLDGQQIIVPANGSALVTERKVLRLVEKHPESLTLQKPGTYTDEDEQILATLKPKELLEVAILLLHGKRVVFADYAVKPETAAAKPK